MRPEIAAVLAGESRWTVLHADNAEVLPTLGEKSVAHVITDPPYGVGFKYNSHDDAGGDEYRATMLRIHGECVRVAQFYTLITPGIRNVWFYPSPRWLMAWAKKGSTRRSDLGGFNEWEPILVYGRRPKHRIYNDCVVLPDCASLSKDDLGHPCPKPILLLEWLVKGVTDPGDVVLDPFAGSGTTGVACLRLGRRFIGIERDAKYAQVARERLAAEDRGLSLRDARAGQTSIFDAIGGGP